MAIPFSRSLRSVHADGFRLSTTLLIVGTLVVCVWCIWFFGAELTLYERSGEARLDSGGIIFARFPADALARIRPGQQARFYLQDTGRMGGIPAVVAEVDPAIGTRPGAVSLYVTAELPVTLLAEQRSSGRIEIATEVISPAVWLLRAANLTADPDVTPVGL